LIPVFNKPLITYAFERLAEVGIQKILINTHHCAEAYQKIFPQTIEGRASYEGLDLEFRFEPVLLDTAGGIYNFRDRIGKESILVYNGDVLSSFSLKNAMASHFASGNLATLILRSAGGPLQVQWNAETGLVEDVRGQLGGSVQPSFLFTGIYLVRPDLFSSIPEGVPLSVTPLLIERMRQGDRIGGVLADDGDWWDMGTREAYLSVHEALFAKVKAGKIPKASVVHPTAQVSSLATLKGFYAIGPRTVVEAGAVVEESILWEDCVIRKGTKLSRCIVRSGSEVSENIHDKDF